MTAERITVRFVPSPILRFCAVFEGYSDKRSDAVGYGATAYDAILDLLAEADQGEPT